MGNICRSPAAECVFRHYVDEAGLSDKVEIDSAGTIGFHAGNPPDSRMQAAGKKRGYTIQGAARQIQTEDFHSFDLIITMDDENFRNISKSAPIGESRALLQRFCDFVPSRADTEVPDPYYGGQAGFDYVLDLLESGNEAVLDFIRKSSIS